MSDVTAQIQQDTDGESLTQREIHSQLLGLDLFGQSGELVLAAEAAYKIHEIISNAAIEAGPNLAFVNHAKLSTKPFHLFAELMLSLQHHIQAQALEPMTGAIRYLHDRGTFMDVEHEAMLLKVDIENQRRKISNLTERFLDPASANYPRCFYAAIKWENVRKLS